jgi:hypothetical protein
MRQQQGVEAAAVRRGGPVNSSPSALSAAAAAAWLWRQPQSTASTVIGRPPVSVQQWKRGFHAVGQFLTLRSADRTWRNAVPCSAQRSSSSSTPPSHDDIRSLSFIARRRTAAVILLLSPRNASASCSAEAAVAAVRPARLRLLLHSPLIGLRPVEYATCASSSSCCAALLPVLMSPFLF